MPAVREDDRDDDLVMSLVDLALSLPAEERAAYLKGACGDNSGLYQQVRSYLEWEERMGGFLTEPLFPPPGSENPFQEDELVVGRFRIVREVARGGMGIVYEAADEKLGRRVALKVAQEGFQKRLPPEVRHARDITHPNVCKIYEIHTAITDRGETDFITMEFLEGQTLAERLREGPIPETEARALAEQLCAGLAEAHRNNVIHGDLKSSNIILTAGPGNQPRAVITDFGLARQPHAVAPAVASGDRAGTPDYMAPELWSGAKATMASDVFAMGVILWELLIGRRPFAANVPLNERLKQKPHPPRHKWGGALARCLDPDPAKRFQEGAALASVLAPSKTRRRFLAAAAALFLATATGAATYYRATAPSESIRLAILPLESTAETASFVERLMPDISAQLASLKGNERFAVSVIPPKAVTFKSVPAPEEARGITHALHGTLTNRDGALVLQAFLTDVNSGLSVNSWTAQYGSGEVRYIPAALAGFVTGTLHLPPLGIAAVNAPANADYLAGLQQVRFDSQVDAAVASFERAVGADPDSALTYAGLAEALWYKYYFSRDGSYLTRAGEALREAERRGPDLAAVLRVSGLLETNAGRYERAAAAYRRAIELEPQNGELHRRLGETYEFNDQLEQALTEFQMAIDLDPGYFKVHRSMGAFYFQRAEFARAVPLLVKAVELAPSEPNAHFALGSAYLNWGKFSEAERELRTAISLNPTYSALHALGLILMYEERDSEAVPYFKLALEKSSGNFLSLMYLGIASRRLQLATESRQANIHGLELAENEVKKNPNSGYSRALLGYFRAALGDRRGAELELAQALSQSRNDADTRWTAVLAYEALKNREAALAALGGSPREQLADLNRWPDVAELRRDQRFINLLVAQSTK